MALFRSFRYRSVKEKKQDFPGQLLYFRGKALHGAAQLTEAVGALTAIALFIILQAYKPYQILRKGIRQFLCWRLFFEDAD